MQARWNPSEQIGANDDNKCENPELIGQRSLGLPGLSRELIGTRSAAETRSEIQWHHWSDVQGLNPRQNPARQGSRGRAQCPPHIDRRRWLRPMGYFWRTSSNAQSRSSRTRRTELHEISHNGALLTHARGAIDRATTITPRPPA
jgi:hypothetical protein